MTLSFVAMFFRFRALNVMTPTDRQWLDRAREMVERRRPQHAGTGQVQRRPEAAVLGAGALHALLFVSGIVLWRAYFSFPVGMVRFGAVIHAATAAVMIGLITVHVYAAIWVKGTIRAMWYGTVTRAWARQHHRAWYRQMTGK